MTEVPKPLDTALDLLVFAPVGLAMTAAEELPKLAAKGRSRVNTQLMMARVVGQFAVSKGRQELEKRFMPPAPPAEPPAAVADEPESPVTFDEMTAANGTPVNGSARTASSRPAAPAAPAVPASSPASEPAAATSDPAVVGALSGPKATELAIPGYDSLSASQVVQRLAGLSDGELQAVGAYEHAHRGRRTILNRIDQLQGQ